VLGWPETGNRFYRAQEARIARDSRRGPGEPWAPPQAAECRARPDLLAPPLRPEHLISGPDRNLWNPTAARAGPGRARPIVWRTPEGMLRIRKASAGGSLRSSLPPGGLVEAGVAGGCLPDSPTDAVGDGGTTPTDRPIPLTPGTLVPVAAGDR